MITRARQNRNGGRLRCPPSKQSSYSTAHFGLTDDAELILSGKNLFFGIGSSQARSIPVVGQSFQCVTNFNFLPYGTGWN